jgi:Domain of unknown function (DUF4124)
MNRPTIFRWLPALSLVCLAPTFAATVYKTVDETGVVSFSDTPPAEGIAVETVVIEEQAPVSGALTEQRLEDMRETTDRMVADRLAREKHRAEMRAIELQSNAQQSSRETIEYYDTPTVYPDYARYPVRRHWRTPNHPQHPIVRPPLLPPARPGLPGIRPLPGNDYPASLIRKSYDPKVRAALR